MRCSELTDHPNANGMIIVSSQLTIDLSLKGAPLNGSTEWTRPFTILSAQHTPGKPFVFVRRVTPACGRNHCVVQISAPIGTAGFVTYRAYLNMASCTSCVNVYATPLRVP